MRILIIIGIIMFIFALVNWTQSQGYFENFFKLFKRKSAKSSSGETTVNSANFSTGCDDVGISGVSNGNGVIINNSAFAFDEDYAYDDDSDYFDES